MRHNGTHRHRVVIGKDTRRSGYMLESAMQAGFTSVGMDTLLTGPLPTPAIAMLTREMRCNLGVMISASHNLYEDNGIKLFGGDGYKLPDEMEDEIERLFRSDLTPHLARGREGHAERINGVQERYVHSAKGTLSRDVSLEGLTIVVDCAQGAAHKVAPWALQELGARVIPIGVEPNGFNINEKVGATHPRTAAARVLSEQADIGIALDGDADRVIILDEKGQVVDGDQILALIANFLKGEGRLKGPVVATTMSNLGFERYLVSRDIPLVRSQVGDRYVIEEMKKRGSNLGGEKSGHIIMSDHTTTGDGLVAALQVLAVVQKLGRPVSEITHLFEPLPQVLKKVDLTSKKQLERKSVQAAIARGEKLLGKDYLIVRPSGTEPVIRVMGQGEDRVVVEKVVDDILSALS
jgi:phosphoglucosamine mutase